MTLLGRLHHAQAHCGVRDGVGARRGSRSPPSPAPAGTGCASMRHHGGARHRRRGRGPGAGAPRARNVSPSPSASRQGGVKADANDAERGKAAHGERNGQADLVRQHDEADEQPGRPAHAHDDAENQERQCYEAASPKREADVDECEPRVLVAPAERPARERARMARPGACSTAPTEPRRQSAFFERGRRTVGAHREGSAKAPADLRIPPPRMRHEEVTRGSAPRFRRRWSLRSLR